MAMKKPGSASFARTLMTMCAVAALALMVASEHCVARSVAPLPRLLCPVATDDSVIVGYGKYSADTIAAYDGNTGSLLWQIHSPHTAFVGEMEVCGHLLYAPTFFKGVYVLDVRDGRLIQHLQTGRHRQRPLIACMPGYVFIADPKNRLVAIDTADFEVAWRRSFPRSFPVCEITPSGPTLELLLVEGTNPPPTYSLRRNYVQVELRTEDGRILSRKPTARPAHYDIIPSTLPGATRRWLTKLLQRGDVFIPRTEILKLGQLMFVGNLDDSTAPGTLYAIRPDTAEVVWQREVPALEYIILRQGRLVVAGGPPDLMAIEAETGRLLWTAELPPITDSSSRLLEKEPAQIGPQGPKHVPIVSFIAVAVVVLVGLIAVVLVHIRRAGRSD